MTETPTLTDPRRKRLRFRAWHRGMREMDLILGAYADARLADMAEERLERFERLLEVNDQELYRWIMGERDIPANGDHELIGDIVAHRKTMLR